MSKVCAIVAKDFKSLVNSAMFYIVAGVSSLMICFLYFRLLGQFEQLSLTKSMQMGANAGDNIQVGVFQGHIGVTNLLFIAIIPAITMRMVAEEKRLRTFDLLMTTPITASQIALGKFLAGFGAALVLVGISLFYPLLTRLIADFSVKELLFAYLGLALVTGAYVAVGLFASSLTESVLLAVVLGWILNLCLWFVSQGSGFFQNPQLVEAMEHLSIGRHFGKFVGGSIDLSSFVFLLSLIGFFVFLTQRVIESSRWR